MSEQKKKSRSSGFTLLELLIAMVVGLIAMGAVYSVYVAQQRSYHQQQALLKAHQNLRGAMVVLEQQIRQAGFDPEGSGRFGITDVRRYDTVDKEDLRRVVDDIPDLETAIQKQEGMEFSVEQTKEEVS